MLVDIIIFPVLPFSMKEFTKLFSYWQRPRFTNSNRIAYNSFETGGILEKDIVENLAQMFDNYNPIAKVARDILKEEDPE